MNRENQGRGFEAPLLFGFLEVVSFGFLFCSPYLPTAMVHDTWQLLVLWRVATLGSLLYYLQPARAFRGAFSLVGTSLLYGVPFWVSSFCFPLSVGQPTAIAKAFLLLLLLLSSILALSFLRSYWFPAFLGVASYVWFQSPPRDWETVVLLGIPALLLLLPRSDKARTPTSGGAVRLLTVLGTSGWALCLFLDSAGGSLGLAPLSRGVLAWLLLAGAAVTVLGVAHTESVNRPWAREVELSLPGLERGLGWLYGQRLLKGWAPWLVLLPLSLWGESWLWALALAVLIALPGLLGLARRGARQIHVQWWCSLQFVLLWGIAESLGSSSLAWLPGAAVLSFLLYRTAPETALVGGADVALAGLETQLSSELTVKAPFSMASRVLEQSEPSVDFDDSLNSAAPSGFRQRLLERLRQGDPNEESVDRDESDRGS